MSWRKLIPFILEALLFVVIIIFILVKANDRIKAAEHNIEALKDTIEVIQLSNGDLMYEKKALLLEKSQLEEYLGISKKEYTEIEKKLQSKLSYISKLESQINVPSIIIKDSVVYVNKDTTIVKYNYNTDKWLQFKMDGSIIQKEFTASLTDIHIDCPLKIGLTDDYKIFVTSENPYMSFTEIDGALLDGKYSKKQKKLFNVGAQVGIGAQYNVFHKTVDIGPYIGVGVAVGFGF